MNTPSIIVAAVNAKFQAINLVNELSTPNFSMPPIREPTNATVSATAEYAVITARTPANPATRRGIPNPITAPRTMVAAVIAIIDAINLVILCNPISASFICADTPAITRARTDNAVTIPRTSPIPLSISPTPKTLIAIAIAIDDATIIPIPFIKLLIAVIPFKAALESLILENVSNTFARSLIPGISINNDKSNNGINGAINDTFLTELLRVDIESIIILYFFAEVSVIFVFSSLSAKFTIEDDNLLRTFSNLFNVVPCNLVTACTEAGRVPKKFVMSFILMFLSIADFSNFSDFSNLAPFSDSCFITLLIIVGCIGLTFGFGTLETVFNPVVLLLITLFCTASA